MNLLRLLIPEKPRAFPGQRWVRISLRTVHIIGAAGVGGGFLYGAEPAAWLPYLWATVFTGILMVMVEIWATGIWLIQVRGISVLVKLGLIAWLLRTDNLQLPLLFAVLVISGVVSHAPADVRYFSVFHWRRVERIDGGDQRVSNGARVESMSSKAETKPSRSASESASDRLMQPRRAVMQPRSIRSRCVMVRACGGVAPVSSGRSMGSGW